MTGDQADSAQRNETIWVRELLEGGTPLNFNSGVTNTADSAAYSSRHPSCAPYLPAGPCRTLERPPSEAPYTGVQDYTDYDERARLPPVLRPRRCPTAPGRPADWPDVHRPDWTARRRSRSRPTGLDVPSYVTNGNHDALVQGNEDAERRLRGHRDGLLQGARLDRMRRPPAGRARPVRPARPRSAAAMLVPPDPMRRYVSKPQIKAIYGANGEDDAHGFDFVDPAEDTASNDSASYYAWDPPEAPGFRFISIDTISEGGQTAEGVGSARQRQHRRPAVPVAEDELDAADGRDKLIVLFGHHPVRSLNARDPRRGRPSPCTATTPTATPPSTTTTPAATSIPRVSAPLHLGEPSQRAPGDTARDACRAARRLPARDRLRLGPHPRQQHLAPSRAPAAESGGGSRRRRPPTGRSSTA